MKKYFTILLLFATVAGFIVSCNLLPVDIPGITEPKELSAEDAKVEIQAGNQELINVQNEMLETRGMSSLEYLFTLMFEEEKSVKMGEAPFASRMTYSRFLNYFREDLILKSAVSDDDDDDDMTGVYAYNFTTGGFDLVEENDNLLQFTYPADEFAMNSQLNNAIFTLTNLEFTEIVSSYESVDWQTGETFTETETEDIPISANVTLTVDGNVEVEASYNAAYTSEGLPTSMSAEMECADYTMDMSFSGSGTEYKSKSGFESSDGNIYAHDLKMSYASDMENITAIEGSLTVGILSLEGTVQIKALEDKIDEYDENGMEADLSVLNSYIDVEVIQAEDNAKIGHLEFYNYYDADWEETYPALAIVYSDGTYEWLEDIFTVMNEFEID